MADFTPTPGTRVTVGGRTYKWLCAWNDHSFGDWYRDDNGELVDAHRAPDLTRIAELEARLARYAAIGKEAAESQPQRPASANDRELYHQNCDVWADDVAEKLVAEYRAQEGR